MDEKKNKPNDVKDDKLDIKKNVFQIAKENQKKKQEEIEKQQLEIQKKAEENEKRTAYALVKYVAVRPFAKNVSSSIDSDSQENILKRILERIKEFFYS